METRDLVQLVLDSGVKLSPTLNGFSGLCPFHEDKRPSLSVTPNAGKDGRGLFKCFSKSCGKQGGCGTWVRLHGGTINATNAERPAIEAGSKLDTIRDGAIKHEYFYANGNHAFIVQRIDKKDGGKIMWPCHYRVEGGKSQLVKGMPRKEHGWAPLYRLNRLAIEERNKDEAGKPKTVVVVEGELVADELNAVIKPPVVTSCGGSSAVDRSDWGPLNGFRVMVWPDNDEAGLKYAADVVEQAAKHNAMSCHVVTPTGGPGGDAKDLLAEPDGVALAKAALMSAVFNFGDNWLDKG